MITTRTISETRDVLARRRGAVVGFVPTMGFLHEGHLSLIDAVRAAGAEFVVVSLFVNPLQFGPNEDFARYPRDEERDAALLEKRGADLLFAPAAGEMYGANARTTVHVGGVSRTLEGERRPGHFDGVATVVLKLFEIVRPDIAAFGRKDAQQCAVIERMVADLDVPVRLVFGETVREPDGLAMSSRNRYLSAEDRAIAPVLHSALRAGEAALRHGVESVETLERLMHTVVEAEPRVAIDYLVAVDPLTFEPPVDFERDVLLAGAVRVGTTRLIDNIRVPREAIPHTKLGR